MKEIFAIFIGLLFATVPILLGWLVFSDLRHGAVFVWGRRRYARNINPVAFWTMVGMRAGLAAFMLYIVASIGSDFVHER